MVSMPCRLPYTMSVKYLSPTMISLLLEHLQHTHLSVAVCSNSQAVLPWPGLCAVMVCCCTRSALRGCSVRRLASSLSA